MKSTKVIHPYKDERSKVDDMRHHSIKGFARRNKSISLNRGYRNAKGVSKRRIAKFEEELKFRPKLSKKSLMLASYMVKSLSEISEI